VEDEEERGRRGDARTAGLKDFNTFLPLAVLLFIFSVL